MAIIQQHFTANQTIPGLTLTSLTNGTSATSSAIDNSSVKFVTADVQITLETGSGTSSVGVTRVYLLRSADGGTTYDVQNSNALLLGSFVTNADTTSYTFSMDTGVVGTLPTHWKIVVENSTGATYSASSGDFILVYTGKKYETV